jgi:hypothetical protein
MAAGTLGIKKSFTFPIRQLRGLARSKSRDAHQNSYKKPIRSFHESLLRISSIPKKGRDRIGEIATEDNCLDSMDVSNKVASSRL